MIRSLFGRPWTIHAGVILYNFIAHFIFYSTRLFYSSVPHTEASNARFHHSFFALVFVDVVDILAICLAVCFSAKPMALLEHLYIFGRYIKSLSVIIILASLLASVSISLNRGMFYLVYVFVIHIKTHHRIVHIERGIDIRYTILERRTISEMEFYGMRDVVADGILLPIAFLQTHRRLAIICRYRSRP